MLFSCRSVKILIKIQVDWNSGDFWKFGQNFRNEILTEPYRFCVKALSKSNFKLEKTRNRN